MNEETSPNRLYSAATEPVWVNFISNVYRNEKPGEFNVPEEGIAKQTVCLKSGQVPLGDSCPEIVENELFYSGTEPGEYCMLHKKEEVKKEDIIKESKNKT